MYWQAAAVLTVQISILAIVPNRGQDRVLYDVTRDGNDDSNRQVKTECRQTKKTRQK